MNEMMEQLLSRRSIRKYKKDRVPQELIDQIIESGIYAATGKGLQDTIIIQIKDEKIKEELIKLNREIGGFPEGMDPFYGAPEILIVLAKAKEPNHVYDGSLALGNMMMAVHALNLGSCWIHRAKQEFETEWGKQLLHSLGIEEEYEGIGHLAFGYVDGDYPTAAPRKENRTFSL